VGTGVVRRRADLACCLALSLARAHSGS
jgi:hypothetical protein